MRVWSSGWRAAVLAVGGGLGLLSPTMAATPLPPPFAEGEKLIYRIGWGFFEVGEAEMVVEPTEFEGQPALRLSLIATTNRFADAFYKVRNQTTSWVDLEVSRTLHYTNLQNEGKRQRDVVVDFDWDQGTAQYSNRLINEVREPIVILPGTFDPFALTFYVRCLPFTEGQTLTIPTTNGKDNFSTVVFIAEKKRRRFSLGELEAWVLKPDTKDIGGVFSRSEKSSLTFWFSADERRLLLRMESSVSVGSFWVELVRVERPGEADIESSREVRRRGK